MARPRNFDDDAVLDAAMMTFWRNGFEATTTRMLEDATGVGIRGLSNAFGSKEQLFETVLKRYFAAVQANLEQVFAAPGRGAIDMVFAGFSQPEPPEAIAHAGCLMVNTVTELERTNAAIRALVTAYRAYWKDGFLTALRADGIDDADARAEFLVGALWGALGQIKLAGDKAAAIPLAEVVRATVRGW
ncbi:TetR/AcrR family transcriptional regulator [uncultured Tateyamaria sp.]|uniref:TetR/AcrR family transcriptional regulator n=1 Tax=uncultured Tateyamaria sp. TaxID=455651 RepID=UPI0026192299|nr:TetR/AcrR family transcriptional regulator [uncultured Tateyamaria sp.]